MTHHSRISSLDALRGVAAVFVLIYHTGIPGLGRMDAVNDTFDLGHFGVVLFFCISGFVIARSLERRTLTHFWRLRLWRIYPAYLASIGFALAVNPSVDLLQLAANITMVPILLGQTSLQMVYWSLQVELLFYLLATVAVRYRVSWSLLTSLLLMVAALRPSLPVYLDWLLYLPLMTWCAALAEARQTGRYGAVAILFISLFSALFMEQAIAYQTARLAALLVFGLGLMVSIRSQPLRWLGERSYGLYLMHLPFYWLGLPVPIGWFCSLLAAHASYRLIERPAMAFARRHP